MYEEPPPPYSAATAPGSSQPQSTPWSGSQGKAPPAFPGGPIPVNVIPPTNFGAEPVPTVVYNITTFDLSSSPYPQHTICTNCRANVVTETLPAPGLLTWILSGSILLIGCWAGCCLIPCCIPECQDVEHRCPNCKTKLGLYKRL
ncbi:lipopolysaccharide-induced tumor necrosis factor-alpha factor homolog [Tetranychus urticae]|uniref:LITAF domain-containing protein n=1 Tax=Tetranychus urticae TaxID=32264 RepID=T1K5X0_TETUR|nr:lipopolysaccharide-induced tumor necrosis factor-alpha factor homolog [Tetranychus urticae]